MATNNFIEISIPEARDLADYTGIQHDLQSAIEFARISLDVYASRVPDQYRLSDPLMTATLVRYARTFAKGVRASLKSDALAALTDEQRKKHFRLISIRDKYCAHSVNAYEESQPVARYWVERVKEEGISSVECQHTRVVGLPPAELNDLIEIATALLAHVDVRLKEEKAAVLAIVRKMPLEKVLSRSGQMPTTLDQSLDPSKRRPR